MADHADAKLIAAAILAAKLGDYRNNPQGMQSMISLWRQMYIEITFLDVRDADPDEGNNSVANAAY